MTAASNQSNPARTSAPLGAPREPLLRATPSHLVIDHRVVVGFVAALAAVGLVLGVIGLREAFRLLPAAEDTVLTVAIATAAGVTAVTLFVGLVLIPRRVRRRSSIA